MKRIYPAYEKLLSKNVRLFSLSIASVFTLTISISSFAQDVSVDFSNVKQIIDGLGAATSAMGNGQATDAQFDIAYGTGNNQLGLSILRVEIKPSSNNWSGPRADAQKAKAHGAKVLGTPWSPPASMKSNNNTTGGELKTDSYAAYANHLKAFADYMGNSVDVISIQNEPNIKVQYASCDWNATQLLNFCKNNAAVIGKPVMMPETFNFDISYSDPTLNDPAAAANISYIGLHLYGAQMKTYTNAINKNKKLWMTEIYFNEEDAGTLVKMGKQILDCMYNNMNAYIWWYLTAPDCNLINNTTVKKKGWVMAQFSRYIRPGYNRVDATYQPQNGVFVVAFKGSSQTVIVAINQNSSPKTQSFSIKNATLSGMKKYTTSGSKSFSDEGAVSISNNSFTTTLDAQSVNTFVATNSTVGTIPRLYQKSSKLQLTTIPSSVYLLNGKRIPDYSVENGSAMQSDGVLIRNKGTIQNFLPGINTK